MINLAATAADSVLVILVVDELGTPEAAFGAVVAAVSVGGVVGSLIAERAVEAVGVRPLMIGGNFAFALAVLGTGLAPNIAVVAALQAIAACVAVMMNVPGQSLRQRATPERLLGRVVASYRMIGLGGVPLGAILGGVVASAAGVRTSFIVGAALVGLSTLTLAYALRALDDDSVPQVQPG